jgi:HTH-type transcriptional regulator/antitoxin HipB
LVVDRKIKETRISKSITMSDLKKYIESAILTDPEFKALYYNGRDNFKIGFMLKAAREQAGLTQEDVATMLCTHKSAISRIEKHADDIRLSTLIKYAEAFGKVLKIELV